MFIIKKLILKEWFRFFLGATFTLFLLLSVANLITGFLRGNVTPREVIINHILELPGSFSKIFPIGCLIASLFSINKLKNRNELTAIFAAGFSRKGLIFTIIQGALLVGIIQFLMGAYVGPYFKLQRYTLIRDSLHKFRNLRSKGLKASTLASGKVWYKTKNYFFAFAAFDKIKNTLTDVSYFSLDDNNNLKTQIKAKSLKFLDGNSWEFNEGTRIDGLDSLTFPNIYKFKKLNLALEETPKDFQQIEADITTFNFFQLGLYIKKLKSFGINSNEYEVTYWNTISQAVVCIIFALISSLAVFNPNRRASSFGKSVGVIFVFTIFYWLVYSYFLELGQVSKLPPIVACFTVPVVFLLILFFFFFKNRKLSN